MIHFPSQKIPLEDIYTSDLDLFPLSGPWVAMAWSTEDKSALFFLTGNRRTEQHLSSPIHYPPLHLARLGLHTSSIRLHLDLSAGTLAHLNFQTLHMYANMPEKYRNEESQHVLWLNVIHRFKKTTAIPC